jgi:toxin ParE1/3/4
VNRTVHKKPQAKLDLLQHFIYIGKHNLDATERFLATVEEALQNLLSMPGMGRRREFHKPELSDVRSWVVTGFKNHIIFYREIEDGIEVVRVLHGARDIEAVLGDTDSQPDA